MSDRYEQESRVFGSDTWQATSGLFDNPHNARQQMEAAAIDLDEGQITCPDCRLAFWKPIGFCTDCNPERAVRLYRDGQPTEALTQ